MNKVIEKEELVSIAADLFRQKGYSATSIDDIAKRCRLTKGSLYHHFSGKQELAIAALAQVHAYYRDHIFSLVLDRPAPNVDDLDRLNHAVEAFFVRHPYGCLLANLSLEIGGSFETFKGPIVRFFNEWTLCYQKVYEQYMAKDDAVAHAQDAIAVVQGCVLMNRIQPNMAPLKRQHAKLLQLCKTVSEA